eukprot:CAMPEP_0198139754 /NCGR_PEP_ID=MMETSP1443-20131203/2998_1 /TAXON_ID=186043 /ORGANISM="Entomoneis sp., Strain CCMP2396" /LENGTH=122 /DNA_ID=CAMNT_0043801961 /DNA_START=180 /DNA_END=545 /DNA_ORIENTATION=+
MMNGIARRKRNRSPTSLFGGSAQVDSSEYKLKNSYDRMHGSFGALMDYLTHHGGVNSQVLDELKQAMKQQQQYGSTESSNTVDSSNSQISLVTALWKLHQYVNCLSSASLEDTKILLLMTAW